MKLIKPIALSIFLSALVMLAGPWWIFAVACFIVGFFWPLKPLQSFLAGFIAIFLLYTITTYLISSANDFRLAEQIGQIFTGLSPLILMIIGALSAAILGGLSQLTAVYLKNLLKKH
jgi:hypothetical protein